MRMEPFACSLAVLLPGPVHLKARPFVAWSRARGLTPYSVSRVHIDDYVIDIRTERNLGGRSIAARLTAIRQFFKWMGNREFRIDDPTLFIQNPRFRKPLPQPLSHDELAVLLDLPLRGGDGPIPGGTQLCSVPLPGRVCGSPRRRPSTGTMSTSPPGRGLSLSSTAREGRTGWSRSPSGRAGEMKLPAHAASDS
jgi:hypothetical protein